VPFIILRMLTLGQSFFPFVLFYSDHIALFASSSTTRPHSDGDGDGDDDMPSLNSVRLKLQYGYQRLEPTISQLEKSWQVSSARGPITTAWSAVLSILESRLSILQHPRIQRLCYRALLVAAVIFVLYIISPPSSSASSSSLAALGVGQWPYYNPLTHLPHIPPSIYQIHLDFSPNQDASWNASALHENANKMFSWVALSPSYAYTLLDTPAANAIITSLSSPSTLRAHPEYARYVAAYNRLTRGVMRADFLRYLLLALDGGVYSDTDTELLRPIRDWVPDEYKNRTRLVVGVEGDSDPPVEGHLYQVQICQWTLASAKGHEAMWAMVERIVGGIEARLGDKDAAGVVAKREIAGGPAYAHGMSGEDIGAAAEKVAAKVQESAVEKEEGHVSPSGDNNDNHVEAHPENDPPSSSPSSNESSPPSDESSSNNPSHSSDELPASASDELEEEPSEPEHDPSSLTDEDVLAITGPRGWTLTIYAALSAAAGSNITWHNLTGMREPRLFGDILVLPIDGFATGLPHSGSTREGSPDAMVRHGFSGSWRGGEA
jgi:hypothetical protein